MEYKPICGRFFIQLMNMTDISEKLQRITTSLSRNICNKKKVSQDIYNLLVFILSY